MPKWVTKDVFLNFKELISNQVQNVHLKSDQTIQRLLWLGDHLQSEEFQEKVINDLVLPVISLKNCTLFLNEAFKKLKACEDSGDIWYMLLNTCMNFTAKNLITISYQFPQEITKINQKITEEIIDRALKYHRRKNTASTGELLNILFQMRQCQSPLELIKNQKQIIRTRKINFQSHPSINWKLSNLSSIVNKETQSFKFSDFNWKLVARMEEKQVLRIYLKLENFCSPTEQSDVQSNTSMTTNEEPEIPRITCLYFLLNLNNNMERQEKYEMKTAYLLTEKNSQILLCQFKGAELHAYDQQKLEFTVYLNTDQLLTLAINYIYNNLGQVMQQQPNFSLLELDDIEILLKATPKVQKAQENALFYLINLLSKIPFSTEQIQNLMNALSWSCLNPQFLKDIKKNPLITGLSEVQLIIDQKLLEFQQQIIPQQTFAPPIDQCTILKKKIQVTRTSREDRSPLPLQNRRDKSQPITTTQPNISRVAEQKDRQFFQNEDQNNTYLKTQSQSQERQNTQQVSTTMPINKLDKLKKNSSQSRIVQANNKAAVVEDPNGRRESFYSQNSQPQVEKSFVSSFQNQQNNKIFNPSQQIKNEKELRKKNILEEINIVNFLKTNDPQLVQELNDILKQFM